MAPGGGDRRYSKIKLKQGKQDAIRWPSSWSGPPQGLQDRSHKLPNIFVFSKYRAADMHEVFGESTKLPDCLARIDENISRSRDSVKDDTRPVSSLVQKIVADWLKAKGYLK